MVFEIAWQTSLLLGAGLLGAHVLRSHPARAHLWLVACAVGALAAPTLSGVARALGLGLIPAEGVVSLAGELPPESAARPVAAVDWEARCLALFRILWISVSAFLVLRASLGFLRARRRARTIGRPAPARTARAVERTAEGCGWRSPLLVLEADADASPAVWAWGRPPRLFLPPDLSGVALRAASSHELAHLQRRDHWSALACDVVVCLLPWQPLAWLVRRRAAALAEEACDARAVAAGVAPVDMAQTVLDALPARAALGLTLRRDRLLLESRLARLLAPGRTRTEVGKVWGRGLAAGLVCTLVGLALAQPAPAPPPERPDASRSAALWEQRLADLRAAGHVDVIAQPGELDLGTVLPGTTARGRLVLLNPGAATRAVLGAKASCGCTRVQLPESALVPAGGLLELPVEMDAPEEPGAEKTKVVTLRIEGQGTVQIPVKTRTRAEASESDER